MDIDVFSPTELQTVFRVLRTVLGQGRVPESEGRKFLETYARITGYTLRTDPPVMHAHEVWIDGEHQCGFFFVQFAILQFHQGIRITPVAPLQVGCFDPEKVLWAIHRGARCSVDITHQLNFWPLMSLPLEEARERLGLLPPLQARP